MSEAARDLYSFLRSKDFISTDDRDGASAGQADSDAEADGDAPRLRSVDAFQNASAPDADHASDAGDASDAREAPHADVDLTFDRDDVSAALRDADAEALHHAPFGVIRVDDDGFVQFFNRYESELSGVDPSEAVGQNFFTQLAPCSNNRLFRGRFKKGLRQGELDERFTYTYTYKMRPTLVEVRMLRDADGQNWILVQKR